jgi:hypothetical protein
MSKERKLRVGKDSVVIGDVSGNVGNGSVVVGPTDSRGNTIINTPMAVGRGAYAGPGSIAIGAGAGAGSAAVLALNEIGNLIQGSGDRELIGQFIDLVGALNSDKKDKSLIQRLWAGIKDAAVLNGAISFVTQVSTFIASITK